jgi:hypothetical protein
MPPGPPSSVVGTLTVLPAVSLPYLPLPSVGPLIYLKLNLVFSSVVVVTVRFPESGDLPPCVHSQPFSKEDAFDLLSCASPSW